VRETRRGKPRLLERMRWPERGGGDDMPGSRGSGGPAGADAGKGQRHALDWRAVQARLSPVRHRWDLAILCNLDEADGRRPADLLAAVNSQAGAGRQLSSQVQSGRLRELEHDGYIRHEDLSVMPLHRVYYLQPRGRSLISDLARIISPGRPARGAARAPGQPSVTGQ
jgi:DNA-binding HxlR family transcriptional regulator